EEESNGSSNNRSCLLGGLPSSHPSSSPSHSCTNPPKLDFKALTKTSKTPPESTERENSNCYCSFRSHSQPNLSSPAPSLASPAHSANSALPSCLPATSPAKPKQLPQPSTSPST